MKRLLDVVTTLLRSLDLDNSTWSYMIRGLIAVVTGEPADTEAAAQYEKIGHDYERSWAGQMLRDLFVEFKRDRVRFPGKDVSLGSWEVQRGWIRGLLSAGKIDEAIAFVETVDMSAEVSASLDVPKMLGVFDSLSAGQVEKIQQQQVSQQKQSRQDDLRGYIAEVLVRRGELDRAQKVLEPVVHYEAWPGYAAVLRATGDELWHERALALLEAAGTQRSEGRADMHVAFAAGLAKKGRFAEAREKIALLLDERRHNEYYSPIKDMGLAYAWIYGSSHDDEDLEKVHEAVAQLGRFHQWYEIYHLCLFIARAAREESR
jgi:tetratricopeptide (TPR) repeat protein